MSNEWFYIISRKKDEQNRDLRGDSSAFIDGSIYRGNVVPIINMNTDNGGQDGLSSVQEKSNN
jgi:hypothetical protein